MKKNMKQTLTSTVSVVLALVVLLCLSACGNTETQTGSWEHAVYLEDTELGTGEKTIFVEVQSKDKTVTFTIHTNQDTVGAALLELELITGDEGAYGLYVKTVNGILADYDIDQSYWALYINGEYAMTGVDTTEIAEGTTYRLAYAK